MNDVMIDLETLGTGTNALILSIGAQVFDLEKQRCYSQRCIHINIDPADAQRYGQVIDASTVGWWMEQDITTRDLLKSQRQGLVTALTQFADWLSTFSPYLVWGNGSTFDISILEDAYNLVGFKVPWEFRDVRDMRTIIDIASRLDVHVARPEPRTAHNALADAIAQADWVVRTFSALQARVASNAIHQT